MLFYDWCVYVFFRKGSGRQAPRMHRCCGEQALWTPTCAGRGLTSPRPPQHRVAGKSMRVTFLDHGPVISWLEESP